MLGPTLVLAAALAGPAQDLPFPPRLPDGKEVVTDTSELFLKPPGPLKPGVSVAETPPTVDFSYVPGQDYPGMPWSTWGDSLAFGGKYYTSLGDHYAVGKGKDPSKTGTARVYEYDPAAGSYRRLVDLKELLDLPAGHYTPGKIHSRIDRGEDGWLYFSTHRGSPAATRGNPTFKGDYVIRLHPESAKAEILACGPVPRHSIPNGLLDPKRLIFYGGTASADGEEDIRFFAFDVRAGKVLYAGPEGPARCMILAASSGKVYFAPGSGTGTLRRYDPARPAEPPEELPIRLSMRAATEETAGGVVYIASKDPPARLYAFDTRKEELRELGEAAVGTPQYIATLDVDPTGRYLYYSAGAHGGADRDGTPVVQFDVRTGRRKVIAYLHPFYKEKYGAALVGTYAMAVDPAGDKLYITWNVNRRGAKAWDCVGVTVLHLPAAERAP
ncbi:MAG: YncE family protein [Planctomycetota bacterium]